jgi:hypothetical protein
MRVDLDCWRPFLSLSSEAGLCGLEVTKFFKSVDVAVGTNNHLGHIVYKSTVSLVHLVL